MTNQTEIATAVETHSERKFLAKFGVYTIEVTAQSNGQHFGTLSVYRTYLETYTGNFDSQADAVKFLLAGMQREQEADNAMLITISESDVTLPEGFHTSEEIMFEAMMAFGEDGASQAVYETLQKINGLITNPVNWKLPVRIKTDGFPVSWVEATTIFFSGCALNAGLWRAGENWDYLYCEGYYARIGA